MQQVYSPGRWLAEQPSSEESRRKSPAVFGVLIIFSGLLWWGIVALARLAVGSLAG